MLQRRGGGSTGVLLIIISMLSISIPTSGMGEGSEDGGIVSGCMAVLCISEIMPDSEGTDSDSFSFSLEL